MSTKNNGTLQPASAPPKLSQVNGKVFEFDGVDDLITTGVKYLASEVASFTVGAWIKTNDTQGKKIIGFENNQVSAGGAYDRHLYVGNDGKLYFGVWEGATKLAISDQVVNDNYWYYAVGTFANGKLRLYINGVFVKEGAATAAEAYDGWWKIGGTSVWSTATAGSFKGLIGPVHAYGRALTDAEVLTNYNSLKPRFITGSTPTVTPTLSSSGTSISVAISATADSGLSVTSYILERAESTQGPWTRLNNGAAIGSSPFSDTNIAASKTYYYRAKFLQNDGKSSNFGVVSVGVTTSNGGGGGGGTGLTTVTPTEITDFLKNPAIGLVNFNNSPDLLNQGVDNDRNSPFFNKPLYQPIEYTPLYYHRFSWTDFEIQKGVYAFREWVSRDGRTQPSFDIIMERAAQYGYSMIDWRIMPNCPQWLVDMGVPVVEYNGMYDDFYDVNLPDHNHPLFLEYYEKMLAAIATKYGDHPMFNMVEVGVGRWGEFHTWLGSPTRLTLSNVSGTFQAKEVLYVGNSLAEAVTVANGERIDSSTTFWVIEKGRFKGRASGTTLTVDSVQYGAIPNNIALSGAGLVNNTTVVRQLSRPPNVQPGREGTYEIRNATNATQGTTWPNRPFVRFYVGRSLQVGDVIVGASSGARATITGIGGERSSYTFDEVERANAYFPTPENANKITDMYARYFPNSLKCTIFVHLEHYYFNETDVNKRKASDYPIEKGFGWRADCYGDYNYHPRYKKTIDRPKVDGSPGVSEIWKTAPVSLEVCGTIPKYWPGYLTNEQAFDTVLQEGLDWHISSLNAKNAWYRQPTWDGGQITSTTRIQKLDNWLKKIGYRFVVKQVQHTTSVVKGNAFNVSAVIENKGIAPAYHKWPIAYRLRNTSTGEIAQRFVSTYDIRTILPGTVTVTDNFAVSSTVAAGTYALDMTILDKTATNPFVKLAIAGIRSDGWYQISSITVTNTATSPTPSTEGRIFATNFAGVTWEPGYGETNETTGADKSYVLTGTDTITKQTFDRTTPKLWGGNSSINHELQLICGSTRTERPDQLFTREFRTTGGPIVDGNTTPCLRITKNFNWNHPDQAAFRWFSNANLANQGMFYVRLIWRMDPSFTVADFDRATNGQGAYGGFPIIENKMTLPGQGDTHKIQLGLAFSDTNTATPKWHCNLTSVAPWNAPNIWGSGSTPTVNSIDPKQDHFYEVNPTNSAQSRTSGMFSHGWVVPGTGLDAPEFGKWWTFEYALRVQDQNGLVAGRDNPLDIGNKSSGWVWAATAQGTTTAAAANGSGFQRFYIPGKNVPTAGIYTWCLFPFINYLNYVRAAGKWMEFASVEVWDRFPPDASRRVGAAQGIS